MVFLVFVVPGLLQLRAWLKRVRNPYEHSIYKRLAHYGDVSLLVQQVNEEFAGVKADDNPHFGRHWLAQGDSWNLNLMPWQDVAWVYIYKNPYAGNGHVSNYIKVCGRDDEDILITAWDDWEQAEQQLRELHAHAPWAEVGQSPELEQLWQQDRIEFVRRVDERRETLLKTGAE